MLQILRKKAQSTFIQVIVVVIALVFIFWGVGTNLSGDRQAALKVNDESISFQDYQQAYDRAYQRLSDQFGGNVPKGLAESFGIKQQVINQLIQTSLLRQGAEEMGIHISSQDIQRVIKNMAPFQEDGAFNIERYKNVLAANRMTPTKFEESMKYDRLSEVAAQKIGNFAGLVSDFEIEQLYSRQNEKIAVQYVKISSDQFVDKVVVDDASLKAWYETVKENYQTEPQLKLNYLVFTYADVADKIAIDPSKIAEYYQDNIDTYRTPEQRHARHILLQATDKDSPERHQQQEQKAEEVRKLAQNGGDFSALARQYSEGPTKDSGGDLGFFSAGQMVPAFDAAVFAMQPGEISQVIKTQFGYHIILLEEIKPPQTKSLLEVTAEITAILQQKEAESLTFQVANDAYEGIIAAGSFAQYAKANPGIHIQETDFFTRSNAPTALKTDAQFLDKAFELNKGELSSLIKGQSGYAILYAEDIKEPQIPPFESKKDILTTDYKKAQAQEMADKAAKDMLQSLRAGKKINALAQEKGFSIQESGFLSRQEQNNSTFPASLIEDVFLLTPASPLPEAPGKVENDFYVYSFFDRQIPTMPKDSPEMAQYRENLLRLKQQQLLSAWLRHMEAKAKITRHQSL